MRHILKTTAITSSLVAASFFVGTGMARAQSADAAVPFTGNVPALCRFVNTTTGTLVVDPDIDFAVLTSLGLAGVAGTTRLICNTGVIVSVAAPVAVGAPATDLIITGSTATAAVGGLTAVAGGATATVPGGPLNQVVSVNMTATADAVIPPGTYNFTVTVTAAPQ